MDTQRKTLYVNAETLKRFKLYCVNNGYKMGYIIERVINEWLDIQEEK